MLSTMTTLFDSSEAARANRREMLKPWIDEARQLLWIAAPLIAMQLAQISSITADIIMVGPLGKEAIAATGAGAVLYYLAWLIGYGPVVAISPIVAQILGAHPNDRARTRAAVRMGLWAVAIISAPLMIFLIWAKPMLLLLGQDSKVVELAASWVHMVAFGLPFSLGFGVLRGFMTAIGRQHYVLLVSVGMLLVNIALNYVLIYGHFGAPAFGVQGAGIASACAYAFAFFAMLAIVTVVPTFKKYHVLHRFNRPNWAKFVEVFRLGIPMGMSMIFEAMLFNSATLLMGVFGAASQAAHLVALNIGSVTFMVPLGIGIAATVRVGLAAGAGNHEAVRRAGHTAIAFGAGFMLLCAVVIALMPATLAGLYIQADDPSNADVMRLVVPFLYVAAVFQVFDAARPKGRQRTGVDRGPELLARRLHGVRDLGLHLRPQRSRSLDRPRLRPRSGRHRHGLALRNPLAA